MKIYFNTRQIPALANTTVRERIALINHANKKLTGPEKMLLNISKLLIITPAFLFIAWYSEQIWLVIAIIISALACYPLVLRPMQLSLCAKYIDNPKAKN